MYQIPELHKYDWGNFPPLALGLYGAIHNRNASVALQLSRYFYESENQRKVNIEVNGHKTLQTNDSSNETVLKIATPFKLDVEEALGLRLCQWPGRAHIIEKENNLTYFLDGAHTMLSVQACRAWFEYVSHRQEKNTSPLKTLKVLIFNTTKDRDPKSLLSYLASFPFDKVIFSTNLTLSQNSKNTDNTNHTTSVSSQSKRCEEHKTVWEDLQKELLMNNQVQENDNKDENSGSCAAKYGLKKAQCYTANTINDAIKFATNSNLNGVSTEKTLVQILVTGSIHLVGGVLQIVDPDIFDRSENEEIQQISEEYQRLAS